MSTQYYDPSWWGRAEPIYITACPRSASTKVGSISNVRFINISAISENGMFITGSKESLLRGLTFQNVSLSMKRSTNFQGGMQDYRPGCQGLIEHSTSGVFMAFVQDVNMDNVILDWQENNLSDWGLPLDFFHSSVNKISLRGFSSSYPDPSSSLWYMKKSCYSMSWEFFLPWQWCCLTMFATLAVKAWFMSTVPLEFSWQHLFRMWDLTDEKANLCLRRTFLLISSTLLSTKLACGYPILCIQDIIKSILLLTSVRILPWQWCWSMFSTMQGTLRCIIFRQVA